MHIHYFCELSHAYQHIHIDRQKRVNYLVELDIKLSLFYPSSNVIFKFYYSYKNKVLLAKKKKSICNDLVKYFINKNGIEC